MRIKSDENIEDGYARTKRVVLRRSTCELIQSVYSNPFDGKIGPNRDFEYEGLSVYINGENWKFLDGVYFGLSGKDGKEIELKREAVEVYPWKAVYHYFAADVKLAVEYYLSDEIEKVRNKGARGAMKVCFNISKANGYLLEILPLVDMRHMDGVSIPEKHSVKSENGWIAIEKDGKKLLMGVKNAEIKIEPHNIEWNYKLGVGERENEYEFRKRKRILFIPGYLRVKMNKKKTILSIKAGDDGISHTHVVREEKGDLLIKRKIEKMFEKYFENAKEKWGREKSEALENRILSLLKFNIKTEYGKLPDAGSMWFREVWFRDMLETINQNYKILAQTSKQLINRTLKTCTKLSKNGLVPNRLPSKKEQNINYDSIDATLLYFFLQLKKNKSINKEIFDKFADRFVNELGLIECPAYWSWLDAQIYIGNKLTPTRFPESWRGKIDRNENVMLIEINALWLKLLNEIGETEIREIGEKNFIKIFLSKEFPAHIYHRKLGADWTETSAAIEAAALLPNIFGKEKTEKLLKIASQKLFVWRKNKLFGVLVKNSRDRIFRDDAQYQGAVVWPRETPYLIELLKRTNRKKEIEEILISNLEHQIEEGAINYNNELFALPAGAATKTNIQLKESAPVPVKNPAQLWSQWMQPYFDFIDSEV